MWISVKTRGHRRGLNQPDFPKKGLGAVLGLLGLVLTRRYPLGRRSIASHPGALNVLGVSPLKLVPAKLRHREWLGALITEAGAWGRPAASLG